MISIQNTLISDDLRKVFFCCDLKKCKGACCIKGDAGAPLLEEEISLIEDYRNEIICFMRDEGKVEVERNGVFDYDAEGKYVTSLVNGRECVFVYFEDGIARCAIEKAFTEKRIPFPKPISCHLYPVRISALHRGEAVNYHKWQICRPALERGIKEKIPLYRFLEGSLKRRYGQDWYDKLCAL